MPCSFVAQLMRRYVELGIIKTYIVISFIVALLSVSVLPQWIRLCSYSL